MRTAANRSPSPRPFAPARNPYRGLAAFEQADAADFFGRDTAVEEMLAVLATEQLLVVVGPSGIGKSSAVKAGLLPALNRGAIAGSEAWLVAEMTPERSPLEQLAGALDRIAVVELPDVAGELAAGCRLDELVAAALPADGGLVLVVDQLEELFTSTTDERERRAFLDLLADVASRPQAAVRVVATLRADYFDRPWPTPGSARRCAAARSPSAR